MKKKSNDTIGNRTRDLPACSAVPQPTALPRAPVCEKWLHENCIVLSKSCMFCGSYKHSEICKSWRKWERCKEESLNYREHWNFLLIFHFLQLHYCVFHYTRGYIHHPSAKDVLLHTVAIFITVGKDSSVFCKGTDRCIVDTLPHIIRAETWTLLIFIFVKI